jgi:hypothetical protein
MTSERICYEELVCTQPYGHAGEHWENHQLAADLVAQFLAALDEAREASRRSVLDGTISCQICRALVLETNSDGHYGWHRSKQEWK